MKDFIIFIMTVASISIGHFAQADSETCFKKRFIERFRFKDDRVLHVSMRDRDYQVLTGICLYGYRSHYIDFRERRGAGVCKGDTLYLFDVSGRKIEECRVISVTRVEK